MRISILTDNENSWVLPYVDRLKKSLSLHDVTHKFDSDELDSGDLLVLLSCEKIISDEVISKFKKSIVVHPSKLPKGKGWSPLAWQILEGINPIHLSLFEATSSVDSGDIYLVESITLGGHELNEEIKEKQGLTTIKMVKYFVDHMEEIAPVKQIGESTYYPRRTIQDSRIDFEKSLSDQFDLLRVVDNERYPAFFIRDGIKYILKIFKEE